MGAHLALTGLGLVTLLTGYMIGCAHRRAAIRDARDDGWDEGYEDGKLAVLASAQDAPLAPLPAAPLPRADPLTAPWAWRPARRQVILPGPAASAFARWWLARVMAAAERRQAGDGPGARP